MAAPMSPPALYGLSKSWAKLLRSPETPEATRAAIIASVERVSTIPAELRDWLGFRQAETLACLLEGLTTEQTAECMGISVGGVRANWKEIYSKLDVHARHEAVLAAVHAGWRPASNDD